ncbi:TRAP transporter large permease [Sneathiella aquimaris]|uniref:TRAP transporter large permease n=1 Tax=Sneathiella aquimaris TaxID=2599305 RepID=UPI00146C0A87|nr:TRAP transporter large permease [Sneathiella aquimaris]
MEWSLALLLLLGLMLVLMLLSVPVAFAFLGVNIVGAWIFLGGEVGLVQLVRNSMTSITTFTLAPIPLFLLMGEILFHSGIAYKSVDAIDRLISRVPGRLSVVAVAGGTVFSSLSGSTIANTAVLGSTLLPDMLKRGYAPSIAMGPIMATGSIAMLIPPSALAVLLGSLSGISIAQLLLAGIIPGIMMSILFITYIVGRCYFQPHLAPADEEQEKLSWKERIVPIFVYVVPLFAIFLVVVGSIFSGWATPTESAALGSMASILAALGYRNLTLKILITSLMETAKVSAMILFIIVASMSFSQILTFSGGTTGLLSVFGQFEMTPVILVIGMICILLVLGAFMDQVSMMLVSLPFFMPLALANDINTLWLGVLMLIVMEMSFTTPPFGLLLYVMRGVAPPHISMRQIYSAALPFIGLSTIVLVVLMVFPEIITWLPAALRN